MRKKGDDMGRFQKDFAGISGDVETRGLDPNYRGPYGGMRMEGGGGRAAYGAHRWIRSQDLETWGGFDGVDGGQDGRGTPELHPEWEESGSVRGPGREERIIRDFNANSPELSEEVRGARDQPEAEQVRDDRGHVERDWSPPRGFRQGYSNRGITDAGYSEGWARRTNRGGR